MSPKVSVIMSVYNGEKYLKEAVESILNQTFGDFEFIIINDGSTDKSGEILEEYAKKDSRIRLFHQKNMGLTKSLNRAIKLARGEYIARMDADDISMPERLERQVKFLEQHQEVGVVGCNVTIINQTGNFVKSVRLPNNINLSLRKRNCLVHGSIVFRKEVIEQSGAYNEKMLYAQDYEMLLRISKVFKISSVNEFLYKLRMHKNTIFYKKFFKQVYYTALAKTKTLHQKNKHLPFFLKELTYSFVVIYKVGLPLILRKIEFIK